MGTGSLLVSCADSTSTGQSTGSTSATGSGTSAGGNTSTGTQGSGGDTSTSSGSLSTGTAGQCTTAADCGGGFCNHGVCCESQVAACGAGCCDTGQVCLSDACVVPGADCHTANDCPSGQYCETALGDQGSGGQGSGGQGGAAPGCFAEPPVGGKCLPLPVVCDANGMPNGCVPACEYHPPSDGPLNAVAKWTWGQVENGVEDTDVWSTPTVGRVYDSNCDGKVDLLDSPDVVVVSGNVFVNGVGSNCQSANGGGATSGCHTGTLRMLDGTTGQEIWSVAKASQTSIGFAGISVALADIDNDGRMDIVAVTGEGYVVMLDAKGNVVRTSDKPLPGVTSGTFGWGGGLSVADMDGDGFPEIAFGATVFSTTGGQITLKWTGAGGVGGGNAQQALSTFVDLDGAADGHLELLAGNTAYNPDGSILWQTKMVQDGFTAVGDFDKDGKPDVALVGNGKLWILDGATGAITLGPVAIPGTGSGGPPTVADFDGDGYPEVGVAMATYYSMLKPDYVNKTIKTVWQTPNHDLSSSVTGSSVFDFEGDGKAEVIYADECFLWVFNGADGTVRFAAPHDSFTGTEASVVADVDGDGRAEMLMVSNAADPSNKGWHCLDANGDPDVINGVTWTPSNLAGKGYRGIVSFGDKANSWVGTRTLWNEHGYHVNNVCDDRDSACDAPNVYGSIPKVEKKNWALPWLNNFRQNVQDKGLFNAPDATVSLDVPCMTPMVGNASVRNIGLASLPAGVQVSIFKKSGASEVLVGQGQTVAQLFPGQTAVLGISLDMGSPALTDTFIARIINDPPTYHECNPDNDASASITPQCVN